MRPQIRLSLLPALLAACGLAALTRCGGSTAARPQEQSDATSTEHDAAIESGEDSSEDVTTGCGFSCDVADAGDVTLVVCPATAPAVGSACTLPEGEECEYGASWWLGCDVVVRCMQGVWKVAGASQACLEQDAGGACPATFAEAVGIDAGADMCPAPGCQYPDGYCECLVGCGGGGQSGHPRPQAVVGQWYCKAATPQCPSPRPDLGTSCDSDARCLYGMECGCGAQLQCTEGVWQGFATFPCP